MVVKCITYAQFLNRCSTHVLLPCRLCNEVGVEFKAEGDGQTPAELLAIIHKLHATIS